MSSVYIVCFLRYRAMIKLKPIATSHAEIIIMKITINCESRNPVDFENRIKRSATPESISSRQRSIEIKSFLKIVPNKPKQKRKADR